MTPHPKAHRHQALRSQDRPQPFRGRSHLRPAQLRYSVLGDLSRMRHPRRSRRFLRPLRPVRRPQGSLQRTPPLISGGASERCAWQHRQCQRCAQRYRQRASHARTSTSCMVHGCNLSRCGCKSFCSSRLGGKGSYRRRCSGGEEMTRSFAEPSSAACARRCSTQGRALLSRSIR